VSSLFHISRLLAVVLGVALFPLQGADTAITVQGIVEFAPTDVLQLRFPADLIYRPEDLDRPLPAELAAKLDGKLAELFAQARGHAVSVAIFVPGQGLWTAAKGLPTQSDGTIPAGFHAASIGKALTAALVLQLIHEKRFTLDTPIVRWFPHVPNAKRITIDHLLSHTSGLTDRGTLAPPPVRFRAANEVLREIEGSKPMFSPGRKWSYFNSGYVLLGLIVERERGEPYEDALQRRLLTPLQLNETHAITPGNQRALLVENFFEGKSGFEAIDYAAPLAAGPVASTPRDLVTFYHALLNHRILDAPTTALMWAKLYPMSSPAGLYWGRGLMLMKVDQDEVVYSAGGAKGFNCVLAYVPRKRAYIAVMCNDATPATAYFYHLMNLL
jgi:D-alanyl-D-alanine carboxypeptidase